MKRIVIAFAAAALVAAALPSQAQAHCRGCGLGLGIVGGVVAGTIIGSAIAGPPVYVGPPPPPDYYDEPAGYVPAPGPVCHIETMQVWDGYGYRPRQTQVCD